MKLEQLRRIWRWMMRFERWMSGEKCGSEANLRRDVAELLKPIVLDLDIARVAVAVVPARMEPVRYHCVTVIDVR